MVWRARVLRVTRSIRRLSLAAVCAASLLLGLAATPALATHFQPESYSELLAQLHHREVLAVVLHPQGYKAHASLSGGGHVTVTYTPAEVPLLRAAALAGGSSFTIATSKPKSTTAPPQTALHRGRHPDRGDRGRAGRAAARPPPGAGGGGRGRRGGLRVSARRLGLTPTRAGVSRLGHLTPDTPTVRSTHRRPPPAAWGRRWR